MVNPTASTTNRNSSSSSMEQTKNLSLSIQSVLAEHITEIPHTMTFKEVEDAFMSRWESIHSRDRHRWVFLLTNMHQKGTFWASTKFAELLLTLDDFDGKKVADVANFDSLHPTAVASPSTAPYKRQRVNSTNNEVDDFHEACFSDLVDDVVVLVLEFLTLEERLEYETVSKEWSRVLAKLWENQKALAFNCEDVVDSWCHVQSHKLRELDCLDPSDEEILPQVMRSILKKCPNLVVLFIDYEEVDFGSDFGEFLALSCPRLEHIHLECPSWSKYLTQFVAGVQEVRLECAFLNYSLVEEEEVVALLTSLPLLRRVKADTSEFLRTIGQQLVVADFTHFENTHGFSDIYPKLERLTISEEVMWRDRLEQVVVQFPGLKAIEADICISIFKELSGLKSLEEIYLRPSCCGQDWDEDDDVECVDKEEEELEEHFCHFLSSNGSTLKRISIETDLCMNRCFEYIARCCPNLEDLVLSDVDYESEHSFPFLAKMKNLMKIDVDHDRATPEDVETLLSGCPHLQEVHLTIDPKDDKEVMTLLYKYQETFSPKKPIHARISKMREDFVAVFDGSDVVVSRSCFR